jgi:hypothetical protein
MLLKTLAAAALFVSAAMPAGASEYWYTTGKVGDPSSFASCTYEAPANPDNDLLAEMKRNYATMGLPAPVVSHTDEFDLLEFDYEDGHKVVFVIAKTQEACEANTAKFKGGS